MVLLIIALLFIRIDPGLAANKIEVESRVEVGQNNLMHQEQAGLAGSSSGCSLNIRNESISQGSFAGGAQPILPDLPLVYGGPWKESWNIIKTDIYKHLETFWSTKDAKKALEGGGEIESLYCKIPYPGPPFRRSKGVNVIFGTDKGTTLPPSAVPIGIVIVKGGEKIVLWHLVAKAVLEAAKRGATWLKIERYDLTPQLTSSSSGVGLAGSGNKVGINAIGSLTGGGVRAQTSTESKPFLHGVAYGLTPSKSEKGE